MEWSRSGEREWESNLEYKQSKVEKNLRVLTRGEDSAKKGSGRKIWSGSKNNVVWRVLSG